MEFYLNLYNLIILAKQDVESWQKPVDLKYIKINYDWLLQNKEFMQDKIYIFLYTFKAKSVI